MKCKEIIRILEELAPVKLAENWDNVGLLTGNREKEVKKIMIALDATERVMEEAVSKQVDMLITHHPMIFSPMKKIDYDDFNGRKIVQLIKKDICYYAMHTNFDVAIMAELAAKKLGISKTRVLSSTYYEKRYKIVVFVPIDSMEKVRDAMTNAGAGYIGAYSHCTFYTEGMGTYLPLQGTNPYIGKTNEMSFTPEYRIETIVTEEKRDSVVRAMLRIHPYEEVAYDIYEVCQDTQEKGIGRYGYLEENITLVQLADKVKQEFGIEAVKVCGDLGSRVASIAVSPGSGKSIVKAALKAKVQVLITGDIDHHTAIDAREQGLSIIDAGHFGTEHPMVEYMKKYFYQYFDNQCSQVGDIVVITAYEKDPFCYI